MAKKGLLTAAVNYAEDRDGESLEKLLGAAETFTAAKKRSRNKRDKWRARKHGGRL